MEYLMTYGWAILIIAVVLAALFELGVFNANNLGPRAQPGSCHVLRPDGHRTTGFINLEGLCNGEIPQYVAQFNGQTNNIEGSNVYAYPLTATAWIYPTSTANVNDIRAIMEFDGPPGTTYGYYQFFIVDQGASQCGGVGGTLYLWNPSKSICTPFVVPLNKWSFVAFSVNSTTQTVYLDTQSASTSTSFLSSSANSVYIISDQSNSRHFEGSMSNIQIYNTTLSANGIQALYQEGIGGAPISLQNLVGWWPFNGNAQDYSGNNNNGQINGVTFTGSWTSGYTAP